MEGGPYEPEAPASVFREECSRSRSGSYGWGEAGTDVAEATARIRCRTPTAAPVSLYLDASVYAGLRQHNRATH